MASVTYNRTLTPEEKKLAGKASGIVGNFVGSLPGTGMKLMSDAVTKATDTALNPPPPPPPTPIDYSAQVRSIFEPLKNADLSAIRTAFDNAISGYNSQRPLQEQYKTNALNTVDANYYKGTQGLNAAMEAGGQRGGENITGNVALQTVRGNGINDTNQTYTNNLAAIDEAVRRATAEKASQEAEVGMKWDSQIAAAIQAAEQQGVENAQSLAGLTGSYIDPKTGVSTPTLALNQYNAGQEQQAWQNKFQEGQAATQASQFAAQMAYQASRDQVLDDQWLKQFNLSQQKMILDNALQQRKISQDDYSNATARMNAETNQSQADWSQDPNNPDNIYKLAQSNPNLKYTDYVSMGRDMLDKGFTATDSNPSSPTYGQQTYSKVYKPDQVLAWIRGLNITPEQKAQLANDLGL